jgi:hypothetical protein
MFVANPALFFPPPLRSHSVQRLPQPGRGVSFSDLLLPFANSQLSAVNFQLLASSPFNISTFKPSNDPQSFSPCSPSVQKRPKREQTIPLFSEFYKRLISQLLSIQTLTNAQGGANSQTEISSLTLSALAAIPFRITFFAHPHLSTPIESYSCKKHRGGGPRPRTPKIHPGSAPRAARCQQDNLSGVRLR